MSSAIAPATSIAPVVDLAVATPGLRAADKSLLPPPQLEIGSIESLYALMVEANDQQNKAGKDQIEHKFDEKRAALEKYKAEVAKAKEENENSGGIFKTIASVAMVVVAAVATACTLGGAAPVLVGVGLALSAGGFFVQETKCFGDASQWIGMGMQLCGTIVTCGASTGSELEQVAEGAQAVSAVAQGAQKVKDTLREKRADDHMREATGAQQQMRRLQDAIEDAIVVFQDAKDASRRGAQAVNEVVETEGQTLVLSAGGKA